MNYPRPGLNITCRRQKKEFHQERDKREVTCRIVKRKTHLRIKNRRRNHDAAWH